MVFSIMGLISGAMFFHGAATMAVFHHICPLFEGLLFFQL